MAAITLALVDDHAIVRKGIRLLLEKSEQYDVIFEGSTADEFLLFLVSTKLVPDIVLLDVKMPGMSALQATRYLSANFPIIRIVIFSMVGHIDTLTELIANGALGYIAKSFDTQLLLPLLQNVMEGKGIMASPDKHLSVKALNSHLKIKPILSEQDKKFLKLCATDLTYQEIALQLNVSLRSVNSYSEKLFDLLSIRTRTGLAMYAVRNGMVE